MKNDPTRLAMDGPPKFDKEFPHDRSFPDNVNPTEENRKAWSDKIEADRKAGIRGTGTMEEGLAEGAEAIGQTKTVSDAKSRKAPVNVKK